MKNLTIISGYITPQNELHSERLSGTIDTIPLANTNITDTYATIIGHIETHNTPDRHVLLYLVVDEVAPYVPNVNQVLLEGHICKTPEYRQTPKGREITNLLIANTNSFIPCISWTRETATLEVGTLVTVKGRLQSRTYRIANKTYEVSIDTLTRERL